jgi:hypothetical protein
MPTDERQTEHDAAPIRTPERMDDRLRWFRYIVYRDPSKGLENDQARFLLERIAALEVERDQLKEALRDG